MWSGTPKNNNGSVTLKLRTQFPIMHRGLTTASRTLDYKESCPPPDESTQGWLSNKNPNEREGGG